MTLHLTSLLQRGDVQLLVGVLHSGVAYFFAPEYFLEHFLGSCELAGHVATGRATWLRVCQSGFPGNHTSFRGNFMESLGNLMEFPGNPDWCVGALVCTNPDFQGTL